MPWKRKYTPAPDSDPPAKKTGSIRPSASTRTALSAFARPGATANRQVSKETSGSVKTLAKKTAAKTATKSAATKADSSGASQKTYTIPPPIDKASRPLSSSPVEIDPRAAPLARGILKDIWGYDAFRLKQEQAIERLICGGSAVVVFPTGGGKSMVYQVPALAFDKFDEINGNAPRGGITLVVSPLIALMKDQTEALKKRGVKAATLDSTISREEMLQTYDMLRKNELKLLYCAPERLNNEGFVEQMKGVRVRMVAVDEAHCISEWGHAFRPDYLKVARFVNEIKAERVLCLTATATPKVANDVLAAFDIPREGLFRTETFRPNLKLLAETAKDATEKLSKLKQHLRDNPGSSIIYVATHLQAESTALELKKAGFDALSYHAGMVSEKRSEVQEVFMESDSMIIVATIAFGMGVDKANIRNIVHYTVPKSLEGYSQEIGRAGRDGLPSICMLYLCAEDLRQLECFARADVPSLRSVRGCLQEFFEEYHLAVPEDVVEANMNHLTKSWDIRNTTMSILFAQLELRFGLLRAITPKYSSYQYAPFTGFKPDPLSDNVTKAIVSCSRKAQKWTTVDVDAAGRWGGVTREKAIGRLNDWAANGLVELKPSGVVARYRVLEKFPDKKDIDALAVKVHDEMSAREGENIQRVKAVIALLTADKCFARALSEYFGDDEGQTCSQCSFCQSGEKIVFETSEKVMKEVNEHLVQEVLDACDVRDDKRFLARFAWGIPGPRITALRLARNHLFGCLADADFEELVKAFGEHCSD